VQYLFPPVVELRTVQVGTGRVTRRRRPQELRAVDGT